MKNPEDKQLGRPKGSKNKRSNIAIDRVEHYKQHISGFLSPLDFLLLTMNGLDAHGLPLPPAMVDVRVQIDCAKTAVKYTNAQLTSIEMDISEDDTDEMTSAEKQLLVSELLKKPEIQAILNDQD